MNGDRGRKYARQWLFAVTLLVLLGVATAYDVYRDHRKTESVEDDRLLVQARVVDENLNHQLVATYESLKRIASDLPYWRSKNVYKPVANLMLKTIEEAMPGVRTLLIIDAKGIARASSRPELIGKDLSNREYFQTVRRRPDPVTLYLSPPSTTVLNVYAMNVSRMIPGPNNEFNGVIVATLDPEYCKTLLLSVQYAPDMWVAIAHGDGIQFLMVPDREGGQSGKDLAQPGSFFSRHRDSGRDESIMSGTVYATGEERVMALRTIRPAGAHLDKPLVVAVGRDLHAVFSDWRRIATIYGSLFLGIVVITIIALRYYQIRVQRADERVRQSKAALEKNEKKYQLLIESLQEGIWLINKDGNTTFVNQSMARMLGYSVEDMLGKHLFSFMDERGKIIAAQQLESRKRGVKEQHDFEFLHRDGNPIYATLSTSPILDDAGNYAGALAGVMNITERRRVEAALHESEERFRNLFEKIQVIALVIDPADGAIVDANAAAVSYYGWSRDQLRARKISDINTLSPESIQKEMESAKSEQRSYFLFRHRRADDTIRDVEVYSGPIWSGGKTLLYSMVHDITERKRAEENLRDTKELLALFVRNSPIYAFIKEVTPLESRVLQASENFHQMIGIAGSHMTGKTMAELFPPEFAAKITADDWAVVSRGEVLKLDEELNGRSYTTIKFPLVQGERTLLAGYTLDITERKLAEEKVKRLANEQQIILSTIAIGIVFVKDRRLVWTNRAFEKIFGYRPEELRGLDARILYVHAEDYERVGREGYDRLAHGETYMTEALSASKDGRQFWLNFTGRAVNPGDLAEGSIWMLQDITERKLSETRLQESERLFRESIEFLTIPIGIATANGTILHYNKSFTQTYGYTVQDIPSIESWMQTAYPDAAYRGKMQKIWEADIVKAIEARESTPIREYDVTCKDGRVKHVEIAMRSIGPLFIAAFYDITDRRHAEDVLKEKTRQLEDLTRNLEQRVEEEVTLRKKNEDILVQQSKMAAMGEMLGAIAHQWRQPLNILGLIVQNLEDAHAYGKLNKEYLEKTVHKAMAQIQHMSKTIDDFRNFYRPDKEKTVFDAMRAVGDVLALFTPQLHASDIHYRLTCHTHKTSFESHSDIVPCPEKTVTGYRNEFAHAVLNLVNNARESILERRERGNGPQSGFLNFDFHNRDGKIIIQVSDNGGGIDPKILSRIFEPYFTSKDPARGTGLGLYMSKVIIEDHMGGTLAATNGEQGAVFTIELAQADAGRTP